MSRVVRKPAFCICENKDADQLRGNREADQRLCFRYIDSTIYFLNRTFSKKDHFLVRKFQKFCVWLLTLYAFIICQVIIRTQYYTNASLISAPVVI